MLTPCYSPLNRILSVFGLSFVLLFLLIISPVAPANGENLRQSTPTGILAEAIGEINLRSGPGIEFYTVGQISAGTRYQVIGRSEFYPWLLLAYPDADSGTAWVYQDLVTVTVPISQIPIALSSTTVTTPTQPASSSPAPSAATLTATPTAMPAGAATQLPTDASADFSVFMETESEINVRFGPGIDYPRVGRIAPGERYGVISRHALYPWILIDYPPAPSGTGWIFADVVTVIGNLNSLPAITVAEVGWPTLTPTPPFVVTALPPWETPLTSSGTGGTATTPVNLVALGEDIQAYLLAAGFAPEEDTFGSVFVLDLQTGENFSLGQDIAYSGMSLIKIPILVELFRQLDFPPDPYQAEIIVNTMICSGNHTANDILALIGDGDPFVGAQSVTQAMQALGLQNTFTVAPFKLGDEPVENRPVVAPEIPADQSRTIPDPFNQTTPEDLGWLLGAVYQCAVDESGPLMDVFSGQFTPTECRQIIRTMSQNQINVLTEAGVPVGTTVAHKHGWIDDTHGDASIVLTDGGDFVLTMALYGRDWLPYEQSWPMMAEIARMVYNAYNPQAPLDAIHPATVDESCNLVGNPLLAELQQSIIPPF